MRSLNHLLRPSGRLITLFIVATLVITACQNDGPLAPERDKPSLRLRADGYMCVPGSSDTTSAGPTAPSADGKCPPGFDYLPWS